MLLASAPASAAITFSLDNVNFVLGGSMTGTFTTSDDLSVLEDFSFTTTANDYGWLGEFDGATYTFAAADAIIWSPLVGLSAGYTSPISQIGLLFAGPLTTDGTSLLLSDEAVLVFGSGTRIALTGSISAVAAPVPEPATWAMMIGGLGLAGAMMRRRKASVSFA